MELLDKWADRIYSESDVSRSIATSAAGVVGLVTYLATSDWVIATFSVLVAFPIIRLAAASKHERLKMASGRQQKQDDADNDYCSLSAKERAVVDCFVAMGGCVMTWSQFNRSNLSNSAVETLIQRELLGTSVTADGMTETFVLSVSLYDAGVRFSSKRNAPNEPRQLTSDECDWQ